MFYFDLLYPSEEKRREGRESAKINKQLIQDLKLDELIGDTIMDREEYDQLCEEIMYLPSDREVIEFRQMILVDLIKNPHFLQSCREFCRRLNDSIPRKGYNIWEPQVPVYKHLKEYIELLKRNYQVLCTVHLGTEAEFRSDTLRQMIRFLEGEENKNRLKEIIELLSGFLEAGAIEYQAEYTYAQAMKSVTIQGLFKDNTYMMKEKGLLKRKKVVDKECLISAGENLILRNNMNEIYSKTVVRLCDFASRLNHAIVYSIKRIQSDLSYYQVGIRLYHMYRKLNIQACLPQIDDRYDGSMDFQQLYPLRLLAKCYQQENFGQVGVIQSNDYSNRNGRVAVVTGFNSGGKTTFIQAVGVAQILMQLGFYVPAAAYCASVVPYIGSLFANDEDINTVHGKLEQELIEISNMARQIKKGSLILLNEILATTSEEDGSDIMAEVIHAFSKTYSHIIFVTHMSHLADLVEEGRVMLAKGECAVNYVTEQCLDPDGNVKKTYRINRGKPVKTVFDSLKYFGDTELRNSPKT